MTRRFGRTELPEHLESVLQRAIRIQWLSIAFLVVAITLIAMVLGNSQAMKAAWIEDILSLAPPIAFLVAVAVVKRKPTPKHPYGYHRSIGVAHLVAAVALLAMGGFLLIESLLGLLRAEHPTIGTVVLFGEPVWLGWLMMGVMSLTIVPPIMLGRIKMKLAEALHDKVLYADADMNKADWMTATGSIIGVAGIGLGLWWMDGVVASLIAFSILTDGVRNLRGSISDLMDRRAMTFDDTQPHPLIRSINARLRSLGWVAAAGSRVRDQGHVFHVESFVVPKWRTPSLRKLERAREAVLTLDWKIEDIVIVPVSDLPREVGGHDTNQSERSEKTPQGQE